MWNTLVLVVLCVFTGYSRCQEHLKYSVTEGPTSTQFSANVGQDSGIFSKSDPTLLQNLKFKIIQSSRSDVFTVNSNSGELTPTGQIDREKICPQAKTCTIFIDISALSPPDLFEIIKVTILINDTNDNSPGFKPNFFVTEIPENAAIGSSFNLPKAVDLDSPQNGVKGYRLLYTGDEISLKSTVSSDGSIQPMIQLEKQLDRETIPGFKFNLEAFDSVDSANGNVANLSVTVNIGDINDNPPIFLKDSYIKTFPENLPVNSSLLQVKAIDLDTGDNGNLIYSFDSATAAKFSGIVRIDSDTGEITLINDLDFELYQNIVLNVLATEKNPMYLPAKCTVNIFITDVNDNSPVITVNPISDTIGYIEIPENVKIGAFLAHVSVSDKDAGNNGVVYCTIYAPDDPGIFQLQQLSPTDYKLLTNASLDRESKDKYNIVFVCRDGGNPTHTADYATRIVILDENDHKPVFEQDKFTLDIYENNAIGSELVYLNVTDLDSGKNGEVVFQVLSGPSQYISLNTHTGNITSKASFDYEQTHSVTYEIIAVDKGDIQNTATATVNINVLDLNDEPPTFYQPTYTFNVSENLNIGADVGTVQAYDPDSKSNSEFQFGFAPGSPNSNLFVIEPSSGAVFTRVTFDREEQDSYIIHIRAYDTFLPSLFSVVNVTINVNDTNDHTPEILYPNERNNSILLTTDPSDYSTAVTQIIATDKDSGLNAALQYLIVSGNDDNVFLLDKPTGYVYVRDSEKLYGITEYSLKILVKDTGAPHLEARTTLNIVVEGQAQVLAVNTVIIITVSVLSGVLVSCLLIAIMIIKMRSPKFIKQQEQHHNHHQYDGGQPNHYVVQPVDNEVRDDVSELSVSVLNTCQHVHEQQEVPRISPTNVSLINGQISPNCKIFKYEPNNLQIESRDKFSDGSNSDSGLGSNEEGISMINTPVISMDTKDYPSGSYTDPVHLATHPSRQQLPRNNQQQILPQAKRHLSFTKGLPLPPPYHIARSQSKNADDFNSKANVSHQYPYSDERKQNHGAENPQHRKTDSNISNSSSNKGINNNSHMKDRQGSGEHLGSGKLRNENGQSPMVWEYNPEVNTQPKLKHLSYVKSAHHNNNVAGHEISFNDNNNTTNNFPVYVSVIAETKPTAVVNNTNICQNTGEHVNNKQIEQPEYAVDVEDNKNTTTKDMDDNLSGETLGTADENISDTRLKSDNATVSSSSNNNNNNSTIKTSYQQHQPHCMSNDSINRYPKDVSDVDTVPNKTTSSNCHQSSVTRQQQQSPKLSSFNSSENELSTDNLEQFSGVRFVEFEDDHEENIV